jgi:hypothetical protein
MRKHVAAFRTNSFATRPVHGDQRAKISFADVRARLGNADRRHVLVGQVSSSIIKQSDTLEVISFLIDLLCLLNVIAQQIENATQVGVHTPSVLFI